jgi:hypothetical protein
MNNAVPVEVADWFHLAPSFISPQGNLTVCRPEDPIYYMGFSHMKTKYLKAPAESL